MITKNQTYTYIRQKLMEYNKNVFCTNSRIYATSRFPTVMIKEISAVPVNETIDLSNNSYRITWEVEAYSDKEQGGAEEAYNLIRETEKAFNSIGFRMTMNQPTENTKEVTIRRHMARFTRVICSDDYIKGE